MNTNTIKHERLMKTYKACILIILTLGLFSCDKFLKEDFKSGASTDYYKTSDGMEGLISACYVTNKIYWGQEEGSDFSDCGTDSWDYGQQSPQPYQFTFTTDFNAANSRLVVLWVEFYRGINACNSAIEILSNPALTPFDTTKTKKRLAEVRFLRAEYNWLIVETWGGVVLNTKPIVGLVTTAKRSPVSDFYNLIFEDLDYAVNNLTATDNTKVTTEYGRVTKMAALAFRARMNLTWASYNNDNSYYTKALNDAQAVIASGKFTMYDKYSDVWAMANNTTNTEDIWCINYSYTQYAGLGVNAADYTIYQRTGDKAWAPREGGNHEHENYGTQYDAIPGMARDLANGRPFRRYVPTKYQVDVFNEDIDQRFYGTFKTTWFANNVAKLTLKWPIAGFHSADALTGKVIIAKNGDTCLFMTKKHIPDNITTKSINTNYYWNLDRNYWCLDYDNMFNADGTINDAGCFNRNLCLELHKVYDDGRAAANGTGSERGARDAYLMRISEMYLIAAEAAWKTGQSDVAYTNYLLPLANKRAVAANGTGMLASYGINSGADLTLDYFLDERARELTGEQIRWFDLKRTGTLVARMKKYAGNALARANFDDHFVLRPIPQIQFDAITNKGEFAQNPGY
jgi:starch-binding outer membrane protein, SusD/RagB family